jgi:hypothetical protein
MFVKGWRKHFKVQLLSKIYLTYVRVHVYIFVIFFTIKKYSRLGLYFKE